MTFQTPTRLALAALPLLLLTGCNATSNPFSLDLAPLHRTAAESTATLGPRQPIDIHAIPAADHHAFTAAPTSPVSRHTPHTTI